MADWFHCNKCFLRLTSQGGPTFLLTNCGHIFCDKCVQPGKQSTCFICRTECTTIPLSSNITPDIQIFFNNPEDTLQKIIKVVEFQRNHGKKLFDNIVKENQILKSKYEHAKEYIRKLSKQHETLQKSHQRLRNLIEISSPAPGNSTRRTPAGNESITSTPATVTPGSARPARPDRFIIRGGQPNVWNPNMLNRSASKNAAVFRTPSIYQQQGPSQNSVGSSETGSRTSMGRPTGVPSGYTRGTPGSLNLSGLTFASRK